MSKVIGCHKGRAGREDRAGSAVITASCQSLYVREDVAYLTLTQCPLLAHQRCLKRMVRRGR